MKKRILFLSMILLILTVLMFPLQVQAATGAAAEVAQTDVPAPMDLTTFLQWLISGGGSILAVSWLLERMAWFQAFSSEQKDYTIFGCAIVVGCGSLAVVTYAPPAVLSAIAPYFLIIASVFTTVFIAKAFHKADKTG